MAYKSVAEMADVWSVSARLVQKYCSDGRVGGAVRVGRAWMVPETAVKPEDLRKAAPSRGTDAQWVLTTRSSRCARGFLTLRESEERYLSGNFRMAYRIAAEAAGEADARAMSLYLAARSALNMGDSVQFFRAESGIRDIRERAAERGARAWEADFAQAAIAVHVYSPDRCPRWITDCDLSQMDARLRPLALGLCVRHALAGEDPERALGLSEAALAYGQENTAPGAELILRVYAAAAAARVRESTRSGAHMARALEIAQPRGFVTPFSENMSLLKGVLDPFENGGRFFRQARSLAREIASGRARIRDALREANAELLLSAREYGVARLKRDGMSDADIARSMGVSLRSAQGCLQRVFAKLAISTREELIRYIGG